jgi:hypothetical protein
MRGIYVYYYYYYYYFYYYIFYFYYYWFRKICGAVLAIILAVSGYDVDCACFSDYLQQRDKNKFSKLFKAFEVDEAITYGNFNDICNNFLNANGDIEQIIKIMVATNSKAYKISI